ncbi:hypothetical protein QBC46DRAFT_255028 [Diplogelasinospora grovesii]|uniref:Uncharacterized protein n=1 Tax=Diplogelasinospora grovesii TaxID=303347 RepID=A0AAN6NC02_9PEZI|nr:hypothetical protein QBC46DRAFT_255028 [Diplogelasinospora grovesii]
MPENVQKANLPRTRPIPLFEISPLLLDLDAEGNEAVRPATEQDDAEQAEKWALSNNTETAALLQRMDKFREELKAAKKKWQSEWGLFDERRLTHRDILSIAFLGTDPVEQTSDSRDILDSNGIPHQITDDEEQTIQFMFRRMEFSGVQPTDDAPEAHEPEKVFEKAIKGKNFQQIQRMIFPLLQTDVGCWVVSRCSAQLIAACTREERSLTEGDAWRVRVFLKNVEANLASRGSEFNVFRKIPGGGNRSSQGRRKSS